MKNTDIKDSMLELKKFLGSKENLVSCNTGTIFESSYPKIIVDILTIENSYISPNEVNELSEIKTIHFKNQTNNKVFNVSARNLISIKVDKNSLIIKYLRDDKKLTTII